MGLDYSFGMWVPHEQLFDAFCVIARLNAESSNSFAPLIWPDGRRLPVHREQPFDKERDLIPFDSSLREGFCSSFWFESDAELRAHDEEGQKQSRRTGTPIHSVPQEDGRYRIGCIYVCPRWDNPFLNWLEDEPWLTCIDFTAATTSMSHLFARSSSVQRFFIELAREVGAVSCYLDQENSGCVPLYLDGEEIQIGVQRGALHPRWLRHIMGVPLTEAQRQLRFCNSLRSDVSAHDRMELSYLLKDKDSGLRIAALSALARIERDKAFSLVEAATHDSDWRSRALAGRILGLYRSQIGVPRLEQMLADVHPEVRIVAALMLGHFETSFEVLSRLLLSTPTTTENLGVIKAALSAIARRAFTPSVLEVMEAAHARPDFPFKNTAAEKLNILRRLASL